MKVCPTCSSEWPDETKFCPNDGSTLRSAGGAADLVGSVIADRYHIVKKLGEGGMGAVYLGEHVKMGRKSAIKVMTQSMTHDPDAIARFNREAANAARITHPNVCAIYDFGETHDGLIYLAMEFIEGGSLTSIIEKEGALSPRRAAKILQQTGDALQAAHDLGIVHRDLKPDNIMISRGRDGSDVVKVVDFGIAKAMSGDEGQKVTKTGLVVGTPEYMSPEQLSGDKLDGRSDIYSLALVFFRMLTGSLPFQADSAQETMIKRLTDEPMKLNEAMPDAEFPNRLQMIMDRALARMPSERYASAAEFARDVFKILDRGSGPAPAIDEGATQMIDAQGAKTQIAMTRVTGSKAGGARTAVSTPPTPMPQTAVVRKEEKKKPVALIAAVVGILVVGGGAAAVMLNKGGGAVGAGNPSTKQSESVTSATAQPAQPGNTTAMNPSGIQTQTPVRPPAGNSTNTTSRTTTQPGQNPATTTGSATRADSAALDKELVDLFEQLDSPGKADAARRRLVDIFSTATTPASLRGEAASYVSVAYQGEGKMDEACQWIGRALSARPGWDSYKKIQTRLACQ
jgi:serine/threonine-protein kinase